MSDQTITSLLNAAADLVAKPGAWTQGYVARDKTGRTVDADARAARCWCGIGAVMRTAKAMKSDRVEDLACKALHRFAHGRGFTSFGKFNDAPERTQDEVVAALRKVAQSSEATHA